MASKHAFSIVARGESVALRPRPAAVFEEVWRRERQERLTSQLARNAEVRLRWKNTDQIGRDEREHEVTVISNKEGPGSIAASRGLKLVHSSRIDWHRIADRLKLWTR